MMVSSLGSMSGRNSEKFGMGRVRMLRRDWARSAERKIFRPSRSFGEDNPEQEQIGPGRPGN